MIISVDFVAVDLSVVSASVTEPDAPTPVGSPHVATDNSGYLSRVFIGGEVV